jgi:hypothetical protein
MSGGIDKLILLSDKIEEEFLTLAREKGYARGGFDHVVDLQRTQIKMPVILHCDGRYNGKHLVELVGVARLGLKQTQKLLEMVIGDISAARIFRIDFCADMPGIRVWDLAEIILVSRTQNFRIYHSRRGTSFYLQISAEKTIHLYEKVKQVAAKGNADAKLLYTAGEQVTRIEVQLKGRGVPFKEFRHLHRYLELDLFNALQFKGLRIVRNGAKPLHVLAGIGLRHLISLHGLQGAKKRFPPSRWASLEKTFFRDLEGHGVPDIGLYLERSNRDWFENRIRFPRLEPAGNRNA